VNSRLVTVKAKPASGFALVLAAHAWGGLHMPCRQSEDRMHPGECRA